MNLKMEKYSVFESFCLCENHLAVLLDTRSDAEFCNKIPNVPKLIHIPENELDERWIILPLNLKILIFDTQGENVMMIAKYLHELNFDVACVDGGMLDWEEKMLPVMNKNNTCLHNDFCECACKKK